MSERDKILTACGWLADVELPCGFPYPEAGTIIDCEYLVSKYAPKELATFVIADWLRAEQVEAKLNQVDELLFRMDELLTNPVDIDGLNELFCNLRKALADKPRGKANE